MPQFRDAEGNIWEATGPNDPNPVFVSGPQRSGGAVTLPAAPEKPQQAPARTAPGATTEGLPAGYIWIDPNNPGLGVQPIPGVSTGGPKTPAQEGEERDRVSRLNQLVQQINRVEQLYRVGPGATTGLGAIKDYFPTDANSRLDVAGAQLSQQGLAAFRVPGTGTVSDRDAAMFDRGNLPTAATRDVANEEILRGLKARVEEELSSLGQPAPQWGTAPKPKQDDQNAMTALRMGSDPQAGLPGRGDVGGQMIQRPSDVPPQATREINDLRARMLSENGGRLDPEAYAAEAGQIFSKYGIKSTDAAAFARNLNEYLDAGGTTIPNGFAPPERLMTASETMRNNLLNNPIGGALAGVFNGVSAGMVDALAPGQMMALRDAQPAGTIMGEIGGSIGGIGAGGRLGRAITSRAAPGLLGGGATGQFARNVGADAAYGAIYGQNTQGDPLTGAALGVLGSAGGQGIARALGASVGGLTRTPAAQALRERGVPVSVGRQLGMGRAEDLASSIPFVGDAVRARQADSFVGFNQAAFDEAGKPIGFSMAGQVGRDGVQALDDAVGNAYNSALGGRAVPLDPQFGNDLASAASARMQLPDDVAARADKLIENHIGPLEQAGQLTGEMYQQARRGLGKARNNANQIAGEFDQPYRETMTGVLGAYDNLLMRGGGQDVIEGLNAANAANKNLRILEDASLDRAKVGTATGEMNVFTPAQLLQAGRKSENKFGGSDGLRVLGEQGQQVLPSTVPNSGTADRTLFAGLLGGAGIAGTGTGYAGDPTAAGAAEGGATGLGTVAGLGGLAALLGTRRGQQVLEQILLTRPQAAQRAGQAIRRTGGMFGSAGGSLAQQNGY